MAKKETTSGNTATGKSNGHHAESALTQRAGKTSDRSKSVRSDQSADALAQRAWETTYKNSRKNGEA
ncbi:MAG: hypothetical protein QOJ70_1145 [Acidobacteriota bacterium]|jgi:hypothetical protein|nr:hypothetical protein [Acidobacteriota bacterium]